MTSAAPSNPSQPRHGSNDFVRPVLCVSDADTAHELPRRWPSVPTRELVRIQVALLQIQHSGRKGRPLHLPGPSQALLDLVTVELSRRRETVATRSHSDNHEDTPMAGRFAPVSDPPGTPRAVDQFIQDQD